MDSFAFQDCLPSDSASQPPKQVNVCPPEVLLTILLTSLRIKNSIVSWSLCPGRPLTITFSHKSFSVHKQVQWGACPSCLPHRVGKLSSTCARNLLDCFPSAGFVCLLLSSFAFPFLLIKHFALLQFYMISNLFRNRPLKGECRMSETGQGESGKCSVPKHSLLLQL